MAELITPEDVEGLAKTGHYIALRVGFAFPMEEINALPKAWIDHYTNFRFMLHDPVTRWVYSNDGVVRWRDIQLPDPMRVLDQAQTFGLRYGIAVSYADRNSEGQRSFGHFARQDRDFEDDEMAALECYVRQLHHAKAPPTNLTQAELEALALVRQGYRLKQIAFDLGVSEGAVKLRLKNAKAKLGAQTSAQAAALVRDFGLI